MCLKKVTFNLTLFPEVVKHGLLSDIVDKKSPGRAEQREWKK